MDGLVDYRVCKAHIDPSSLTHYVIVRNDLPVGFLAAQIVHAAGESSPGNLPPATNAVVLSVKDEAELMVIARRLLAAGIPHVAVREPDPPYNGVFTAIGVAPVRDRNVVKRVLSRLPLFGTRYAVAV